MKIGHLENKPPVAPVAGERPAGAAKSGAAEAEASAQVELSTAAVGSEPEFDAEKVARIAQAIREGRFVVNADKIADQLIANARELLGKSSH